MADISAALRSWSTTAGSNNPAGATTIGTGLDDNLRQIQATVRQYLASQATNMVSAATVDLSTADGFYINVTGTTTITSFGTEAAGIHYIIKFSGALTLTHNATSLILPGAANITTAAGDVMWIISEGAGNWRAAFYMAKAGGVIGTTQSVVHSGALTVTGTSTLAAVNASGDVTVSRSVAASEAHVNITNSDNTSGVSLAINIISTGGASGGDPYSLYRIAGVTDWACGIDNSDSDSWGVWQGSLPGTNAALKFNTSLAATFAGTLAVNGGQVAFPATQIPSADANTLDDYEEGTWTPTIAGSVTPGTQTYSRQTGRYTKIGRLVSIEFDIQMSAKDAATNGNLTVTGLPFASNSNIANGAIAVGQAGSFTLSGGYTQVTLVTNGGSSSLLIEQVGSGVGASILTQAALAAASGISGVGTYSV